MGDMKKGDEVHLNLTRNWEYKKSKKREITSKNENFLKWEIENM